MLILFASLRHSDLKITDMLKLNAYQKNLFTCQVRVDIGAEKGGGGCRSRCYKIGNRTSGMQAMY